MTEQLPPLPFVNRYQSKGRWYAYFRSKETGKVKLSTDSLADYLRTAGEAEALRQRIRAGAAASDAADRDGFAWLVDSYLKSAEYRALSDSTQADYLKTCDLLKAELVSSTTGASLPFRYVTRAMIKAVRDDFADTSRKANKIQQMASRLYSWAQEGQLVPDGFNPAAGLKKLERKGGQHEYVPWSDQEVAWILAAVPLHLKTPVLLALYTGQRREDVATMTWQQVQDDWLRVRTSKTRQLVDLPCHPALKSHLDALPRLRGAIPHPKAPICLNADNQPWPSVNALSGALRRAVEAHPLVPNNRSFHGLRYAAAARMEEGGATVAAIEAVLGHRTFKMALKYASGRLRAAQGVAAMKGSEA